MAHPPGSSVSVRPPAGGVLRAFLRSKPADRVGIAWDALEGLPGGKRLFSWAIGRVAPYSGSIRARVVDLRVGYAEARMRDLRRLRNHLRCLHAVALSNLAEFTGNLALAYSIPGDARFIVTGLNMEYYRKARGEITAVCASPMPTDNVERQVEITIDLRDARGELVSRGRLFSLVGPVRS